MIVLKATEVKHDILSYAFFERGCIAVVTEGLNNADVLGISKHRQAIEYEIKVSKQDLNKELAAIKYATMTMNEGKNIAAPDTPEQMALNIELGKLKEKSGGWSKINKHQEYINPKAYFEKRLSSYYGRSYMPNYFYFVVPRKLVEYTKENIKGTGYGVIAYDGCRLENSHYGYNLDGKWYDRETNPEGAKWIMGAPCSENCRKEVTVYVKAREIHKDAIEESIIYAVLNRAVTENIFLMREVIHLKDTREKYWAMEKELKELKALQ